MENTPNTLQNEIEKFDAMHDLWWDPAGTMGTLHTINPLRLGFIQRALPNGPARIVDVGCGGGILSEALAEVGHNVYGIDLSTRAIEVAKQHASSRGLKVAYRVQSAEQTAAAEPGMYDAVTCLEMLEHVPDPASVIRACAQALRPGGHAFFSSVDRTPKAWFLVIFGGEWVLRLLPRGSHTYPMLVRPSELRTWAEQAGLRFAGQASLVFNPFTRRFHLRHGDAEVNYMMHFVKE